MMRGVHPQELTYEGKNALYYAYQSDLPESLLQQLLDKGANPNLAVKSKGLAVKPVLGLAIAERDLEMVKFFLEKGIDLNNPSYSYWQDLYQPVYDAVLFKTPIPQDAERDQIVQLLLEHKINPNGVYSLENEKTSAFYLVYASDSAKTLLPLFIKAGVDFKNMYYLGKPWNPLNEPVKGGLSQLCRAIVTKNEMSVKSFLAMGADPNALCDRGRPPLQAAIESGKLSMVELLIEYGADVNGKPAPPYKSYFDLSNQPEFVAIMKKAGAKEPCREPVDYDYCQYLINSKEECGLGVTGALVIKCSMTPVFCEYDFESPFDKSKSVLPFDADLLMSIGTACGMATNMKKDASSKKLKDLYRDVDYNISGYLFSLLGLEKDFDSKYERGLYIVNNKISKAFGGLVPTIRTIYGKNVYKDRADVTFLSRDLCEKNGSKFIKLK